MGNWHQDLVIKNASDEELDGIIEVALAYLIKVKVISDKQADNVLGDSFGYCPGEYWDFAVTNPEENHFLDLWTNGMAIRRGRTVFWADGQEFQSIRCPNCGENNIEREWAELFGRWVEDPGSADVKCKKCGIVESISQYIFEPKWALSNLGFVFWNWPELKDSFVQTLALEIGKRIEKVQGKL